MKRPSKVFKIKCFLAALKMKLEGKPSGLRTTHKYRAKGVTVGQNTYIYSNVHIGISSADEVSIGSNCVLTGCSLIPHDASTKQYTGNVVANPIVIEDNCFIGFGSIILRGVTVGKGSIVGAGAIVTKDVPKGSVVVGNPAKVVCTVKDLTLKHKKELGL